MVHGMHPTKLSRPDLFQQRLLFARRRFPGFDAWGNEAPGGSDLHIPGYPVPAYSERALNSVAGSGDDWADGVMRKAA